MTTQQTGRPEASTDVRRFGITPDGHIVATYETRGWARADHCEYRNGRWVVSTFDVFGNRL